MADTTSASTDGGQAPTGGLPQAGTPTIDGQAPVSQTTEHERVIEQLRKENAAHRSKLTKYEQEEQARNLAALSEMEKATKRASEAEERTKHLQKQVVSARVQLAASAKAAIDPELTALALESVLEYGEDGMPTNLDKALEELAKNKSFLFKPADPAPTAAGSGQASRAPAIPAMNPGRSQIASPASGQTGGKPRIPGWGEVFTKP